MTELEQLLGDCLSASRGEPGHVRRTALVLAVRSVLDVHGRMKDGTCHWCSILRNGPVEWPCVTVTAIKNELGLREVR